MPRRAQSFHREISPDPVYQDSSVTKFINYLMLDGKKSIAEKIFYSAMDAIKEKGHNPLEVFKTAIANVTPEVMVKSKRVGGSTYQVPMPLNERRSVYVSFRLMINAMRKRKEYTSIEKLTNEIMDAYEKKGGAYAKKEEILKVAESNKAFSHYRW